MTPEAIGQAARKPGSRPVEIVAAYAVTPGIRRVIFRGDGLGEAFDTPAGAHAPYFKLVLGHDETPIIRTYSVRWLDRERDELHVDFLLHLDDGPGSTFARTARPGMQARIRGPGHMPVVHCRECVLAADHCGLPGLAHVLANLPRDATGTAIVEIPDAAERQALHGPDAFSVEWHVRRVGTPSMIPERMAQLRVADVSTALVWAGVEASIARRLREIGRSTWGVPAGRCQVLNYWRSGHREGEFSYVA